LKMVNADYCNPIGEFISEFSFPKLGDTCRGLVVNMCRFEGA
jgi:hypothetical protein